MDNIDSQKLEIKEEVSHQNYDTAAKEDLTSMERKFIKVYKRLPHLWNPNHPDYNNRFKRNAGYDALLPVYRQYMPKAQRFHIRQKINILRSCYRKELRKHLASRSIDADGNVVYTHLPISWKFRALRFLNCEEEAENNIEVTESETCPDYEEEQELVEFVETVETESGNEESDISKSNISLAYVEKEKPFVRKRSRTNHNHEYYNNSVDEVVDEVSEKEFNAIGANVACKLQRMNVQQRYHAELLINKVLIKGLKECLNEQTDLTDRWQVQFEESINYTRKLEDSKDEAVDTSNQSANEDSYILN